MSRSTMEFEFNLVRLVDVGTPAVKALACLEANDVDAADVLFSGTQFPSNQGKLELSQLGSQTSTNRTKLNSNSIVDRDMCG